LGAGQLKCRERCQYPGAGARHGKGGRGLGYDGRRSLTPFDAVKRTGKPIFFKRVDNFQFPGIKETGPEKMALTFKLDSTVRKPISALRCISKSLRLT
jgi:hypothetical protein